MPTLASDADTSQFEDIDDDSVDPLKDTTLKRPVVSYNGDHLPFIGYSFSREQYVIDHKGSSDSATLGDPGVLSSCFFCLPPLPTL